MNISKMTLALACAVAVAAPSVFAADSVHDEDIRVQMDRLSEDARAVGRSFAREGERVAGEASDFANEVADNFVDAYEESKADYRRRRAEHDRYDDRDGLDGR
ncbi:MAG: hypothetical protein LIP23_03555 [Planctomycetes bacterium]|nr:hypothetical protein [Planctomycetota bacterium]